MIIAKGIRRNDQNMNIYEEPNLHLFQLWLKGKTMSLAKATTKCSSQHINICTKVMETSIINNIHLKASVLTTTSLLQETTTVTPLQVTLTIITTQVTVRTCRIIQIIINKMREDLTHLPFQLIRMIETSLLIKITNFSNR
jgi:hypothetical protein